MIIELNPQPKRIPSDEIIIDYYEIIEQIMIIFT
jgi:hypothetical protein